MMETFAPFVGVGNRNLAVTGAVFRGKKDVGASEFIATLMSLTRRGMLAVDLGDEEDETNRDANLCINAQADTLQDPVDAGAVALLRDNLTEGTSSIRLCDVKDRAQENKAALDKAYKDWKRTVKLEADTGILAPKSQVRVLQGLQYGGYGFVVLALLLLYLLDSVLIPLIPLAIGAALIVASLGMQDKLFVERKAARELYQWLSGLDVHDSDVPNEREAVREILEYAWLFGLEQKVVKSLQDTAVAEIVQAELPYLKFWKAFRAELYTGN